MASKSADTFCGICSRKVYPQKLKYCTDCEDALCSECSDYHGNIKTFNTHHMIDIDVIEGKPLVVNKSCKVHPDMVLEYFAPIMIQRAVDHVWLALIARVKSYYQLKCLQRSQSSAKYEEIEKELTSLNSAVNELEDKKRQSIVNLKDSKLAVQQDVRNIKERLKNTFRKLKQI
ncbi:unnamed protein product [Mytilus edulis]|uniref:B box-type domain-containing protein n=1 Tax=Mytilus edulis TaxID=6550 RepID=A0A8S3RR77_MYTED|nr:unnamed protein product [Mytilus edulis]